MGTYLKGSWELNIQTQNLSWSPEQHLIYGFQPGEVNLNENYFLRNTTHPNDVDRVQGIINNALADGKEYNFKRLIIKKDGSLGLVETLARIIRDNSGIPKTIIGITEELERVINLPELLLPKLPARKAKVKGSTTSYNGAELNRLLLQNDSSAFNYFFSNYKKAIVDVLLRMVGKRAVAEDLCQEVFIKAWLNLSKFDSNKASLFTWLITIARNHAKDYLVSKKSQFHSNSTSLLYACDNLIFIDNKDDLNLVSYLLSTLPTDQREVLELLFLKGYTQHELSQNQGIPLGTVKTKSRTALISLRKTAHRHS
jgi:RNA polymerase sigma-70 factor (ECF subfamily)